MNYFLPLYFVMTDGEDIIVIGEGKVVWIMMCIKCINPSLIQAA